MKTLFQILLSVLLLFSWTGIGQEGEQKQSQGQIQYVFKYKQKRIELVYKMTSYLHFSMERTRNAVETLWGRAFYRIPLSEVFAKSRQGDQISTLFLAYLYLDRQLENRYGEKYVSSFSERKLTDEKIDSIQTFFQERPIPYEWDFIEGWLTFFSLWDFFSVAPMRVMNFKKSSFKFLRAKAGMREFEFQWAFFVIEMDPFFSFEDSHVWEARHIILARAQEGYAPAQYLQGVIEWSKDEADSAVQWLQKAYNNNFRREFASVAIGSISAYAEDFSTAVPYLELAIDEYDAEFLKPDLLSAYVQLPQIPLAFQTAKEIGENYTRFHLEESLNAIEFLVAALLNGWGTPPDIEEGYLWMERFRYIAKKNRNPIAFGEEFVADVKSQLSQKQIAEIERRAAALYLPAKIYSEMDETNPCAARYFH